MQKAVPQELSKKSINSGGAQWILSVKPSVARMAVSLSALLLTLTLSTSITAAYFKSF
jgi:hypothetical protein